MATTVNGYTVLFDDQTDGPLPRLRKWKVPGIDRHLYLRDGILGFIIMCVVLWFHEVVERLDLGIWDEWGWNVRPVTGQTSGYSNHAGGVAADLNSVRHPRGVPIYLTFTDKQVTQIKRRMRYYLGVVIWGGTFSVPDGMHFELADVSATRRKAMARMLMATSRGQRILIANPGAKEVVQKELSK